MLLFELHHKWKDIMWLQWCSLVRHSNFGMLRGSLVGMEGKERLCQMEHL